MEKGSILKDDKGYLPVTEEQMEQMMEDATEAYGKFMDVVKPGWNSDPNSTDTPARVAKMFLKELQVGVFGQPPKITAFDNTDKYDGIVFQGDIDVKSMCSHHHMPFIGKAYVAYIPENDGKIIGLSKLNRIVEFFSRRMQVQENLTMQIHNSIAEIIGNNKGVAVYIEAKHTCVSHRGIGQDSMMKTTKLSGFFWDNEIGTRAEFYRFIADLKNGK
jgi:GTP cyclohydrolase I